MRVQGSKGPRVQGSKGPKVQPWRVAVTRDEGPGGPLSEALRREGFDPRLCTVSIETRPADPAPLQQAVAQLDRFDWVICASQRAVHAVAERWGRAWPATVRTAAVGHATAAALIAAGAVDPVVGEDAGAESLWAALQPCDTWPGRRVLVPNVSGGRRVLIDGLQAARADVTVVEAYAMMPRPAPDIAAAWAAIAPDAVVIVSPSTATILAAAVGAPALREVRAAVAMGATTASALAGLGVPASVPPSSDFESLARHLAAVRAGAGLVT
jgi:uroporphyrinogen-III synthase